MRNYPLTYQAIYDTLSPNQFNTLNYLLDKYDLQWLDDMIEDGKTLHHVYHEATPEQLNELKAILKFHTFDGLQEALDFYRIPE